jgi:hypothetical protein
MVPPCIIIFKGMRSKSVTIVALILMMGFAQQPVCFALLAGNVSASQMTMSGGCHGHSPMRSPAHSCCYADHQVPAAAPVAPPSVHIASVVECVSTAMVVQSVNETVFGADTNDSSPPLPLVLRV